MAAASVNSSPVSAVPAPAVSTSARTPPTAAPATPAPRSSDEGSTPATIGAGGGGDGGAASPKMFGGSKLGGADGAGLPPPVGRSGSEIPATACDTSGSLKLPKSGGAGGGLGGGGGGGGGPPRLASGLEKPLALAALVAFARDGDGGDAVFANGLVKAGVDAAAFFATGFFVLVVDDAPAPPNCGEK